MAHKTRVNGTNYEISGGKTLVNGTAYSIDKGKTLVGGTAYEVGFVENLTVTMTQANPSGVTAGIFCSGGNIFEPGTYQVPAGTEMNASIYHRATLTDVYPYIIFNGTSVGTSSSSGSEYGASYYFTLTKDITFYVGTYGKGAYALFIEEV
jgi:hypothetical protein